MMIFQKLSMADKEGFVMTKYLTEDANIALQQAGNKMPNLLNRCNMRQARPMYRLNSQCMFLMYRTQYICRK